MDPEYVISLFDSCWFGNQSFIKHSTKSNISEKMNTHDVYQEDSSQPILLKQPSILIRSKSDQLSSLTSYNSESSSPTSVLVAPHLQTILSGKEIKEEEDRDTINASKYMHKNVARGRRRRRRKMSNMSKSLSDLEFEELKGFMDLGFVFSEEDKDSSLVDIIPGLHRLGQKNNEENDEHAVTRPYLSEAWQVMEEDKRINALINWRVPAPENEIDMKDSLKWWAHTVASAVR